MVTLVVRSSFVACIPFVLLLAACESGGDDVAAGAADTKTSDGGDDATGGGGDTATSDDTRDPADTSDPADISDPADTGDPVDTLVQVDAADPDVNLCTPGAEETCYSGPAGTAGVGACESGKRICDIDGAGWSPCVGEVVPVTETCLTAADDDCNGETNESGEGCVCVPGSEEACYDGPNGTDGVGVCKAGLRVCNESGTAFLDCVGMIVPSVETCETTLDDDCDGAANEEGSACVCVPGTSGSCYTGPEGTADIGSCQSGSQLCNADGKGYGPCTGAVVPEDESCVTPDDDDCDGAQNEEDAGCLCSPGDSLDCYTGPAGTEAVGSCKPGSMTCNPDGLSYGACMGDAVPTLEDCATPADEDCTGASNEATSGCVCVPGAVEACYEGPEGTKDVGQCASGTRTCVADGRSWGICVGQTLPDLESCLGAGDEDCDSAFNEDGEGCVCVPDAVAPCYSGPQGTEGVGACVAGTKVCSASGTGYGLCDGEVLPATETCETPVDDDCDAMVNEDGTGCSCAPGSTALCYDGPEGTEGVGSCKAGTQVCNANGSGYGACTGQVNPAPETCSTATDDDCDGLANEEGAGCVCIPLSTASCYTGPAGTSGIGACVTGTKTCNDQGTSYGPCTGEVLPSTETCTTTVDDDCDGQTNESGSGCVCVPGTSGSCYSGPAGTAGVGACKGGTKLCNAQGTAFGGCSGEVNPTTETCNTALDDDCDGQTNEDGAGCVCVPFSTTSCYTGPVGTEGQGACKGGTKTCNSMGIGYGACNGDVTPATETCNTPVDDDCDGQTNESGAGCACLPLSTTSCYTGAAGTENVGPCKGGTKTCNALGTAYGMCSGEVLPATETCNTTADDDCDGQTNESGAGCACIPNSTASCYTGPAGTGGVGACKNGTKTCNDQGTSYGACTGEVLPATETCTTTVDDDCDGQTNESGSGCVCVPGTTESCYSGPEGTAGVGACKAGTKLCNAQGTAFGACGGEVKPTTETCNTAVDDDCDGQTNEDGAGCVCLPLSTTSCYTGPMGTEGQGACKGGTKTCNSMGTGYGACSGEVTPVTETCNTAVDDDCDGQTNESGAGCVCLPLSTASCYTGAAGTENVGPCKGGTKTCNALGTAYGACSGEVLPATETCNTTVDDDCDGQTNESGAGCVCLPNAVTSCYTGPAGTSGKGQCKTGTSTCNALGTVAGACTGQVLPGTETCTTTIDDDCDGQTNESGEGCVCLPNSTQSCYSGPAGTAGVGSCKAGTRACNSQGTAYGNCTGEVQPATEACNNTLDDDCDGQANEGCSVTYQFSVKPIFQSRCGGCHTGGGSGGTNFGSSYADTQKSSYYCAGKTVGECTVVRMTNKSMPEGTATERATIQAWISQGMLP